MLFNAIASVAALAAAALAFLTISGPAAILAAPGAALGVAMLAMITPPRSLAEAVIGLMMLSIIAGAISKADHAGVFAAQP